MTRILALSLALLLVSAHIEAQSKHAIDKGSILIGGSAGLTRSTSEGVGGDVTVTQAFASPRALFFVAPRLAVGGEASLARLSGGGTTSSGIGIGPAIRYYLVPAAGTTLPYLGAAAHLSRTTFETSGGADNSSTGREFTGVAGINFMVARQVAITGEAFVSHLSRSSRNTTNGSTVLGFRFGVDAFLLR